MSIKSDVFKKSGDRKPFFRFIWKKTRFVVRETGETPKTIEDWLTLYNVIASEAVNNPKSRFYIFGGTL